jgi:hypothetical protein
MTQPFITDIFRALHYRCLTPIRINHEYQISRKARNIFYHINRKYLKPIELGMFIRQLNPNSLYYYLDTDWLKNFFKIWEGLEMYINNKWREDDSDYLKEFKDFYDQIKANEYKPVKYEFKKLSPFRF